MDALLEAYHSLYIEIACFLVDAAHRVEHDHEAHELLLALSKDFLAGRYDMVFVGCLSVERHPSFVTVALGSYGYFAVCMAWNPQFDEYQPENAENRLVSYATREEAVRDAQFMAEDCHLECQV